MAIGFDAASESHTGTTGSTSGSSFSWTHTPVGTPKGVLVFTFVNANSDDATSVTYGGVSVPVVKDTGNNDVRAVDTSGEPRDCKAWFLGSGVPTGPQTVVVNRANTNEMYAVAITVTSSQDSAVHTAGIVLNSGDQLMGERSVTDGNSGTGNSMRFAAINSALGIYTDILDDPLESTKVYKGSFSTTLHSIVFGSADRLCAVVRETTAGTGSRSVGFVTQGSDDVAAIHLAIKDVISVQLTNTLFGIISGPGVIPFSRGIAIEEGFE